MKIVRYVPSKDNPDDHASRGLIDAKSGKKCSTWVNRPQFLQKPGHTQPVEKDIQMISDTDVEVKYSFKVNLVSFSVNIIDALEKTFSWKKTKRIMEAILKYKGTLLNLERKGKQTQMVQLQI